MKIRNHLDFGAAARATNLLDPTAAQDAATKAYVDSLAGWTTLALVTPSAVNAVDFAAIDPSYSDLRLVLEGISHASGSNQQFSLALSPDGTTFSTAASFSSNSAASVTLYGTIELPGYRFDGGALLGSVANMASSPAIASGTAINQVWRCTGGILALRVAVSSSATFDAGKLRLQARR